MNAQHEGRIEERGGRVHKRMRRALHGGLGGCLILGAALFLLTGLAARSPVNQATEYQVKAALIYKFVLFTEWPKESFEGKRTPFVVAVVGDDPFGKSLDEAFKNKRVADRPVEIRRFKSVKKLGYCHVLFVPDSEAKNLEAIRKSVGSKSVLLIGESKDFAKKGGVINFFQKSKVKLGFEINLTAVKRHKITISSKLLKVARIVEEEGK